MVKYWNRLCTLPDQRSLEKAFLESISLASANKTSWTTSFRALLEPLGWAWNGPEVRNFEVIAKTEIGTQLPTWINHSDTEEHYIVHLQHDKREEDYCK